MEASRSIGGTEWIQSTQCVGLEKKKFPKLVTVMEMSNMNVPTAPIGTNLSAESKHNKATLNKRCLVRTKYYSMCGV